MEKTALSNKPRYTPIGACVVGLFQPATAVRRADHLPLAKAWAVHGVGLVMVLFTSIVLAGWSEALGRAAHGDVIVSTWNVAAELIAELDRVSGWVALLFTVLGIELGWCLLAAATMAWSAGDEPVRRCFVRALRRLLLLTPHIATIVAACGGLVIGIERAYRNSSYSRVGLYDYGYMLITVLTCMWSLWIVLRAVDCRPRVPVCRWPARCMGCGYQLAGLRWEQDCPECGRPIADTLDPLSRPGTALSRGVRGWLIQTYRAMRRPTALGDQMHILSPDTGYKKCLAYTLILQILGSVVGFAALFLIVSTVDEWLNFSHNFRWREFFNITLIGGPLMGLLGVAVISVTALLGAGVVGFLEGRAVGRNLMPAAVRAACYHSGFMVLWSVVCWCNFTAFVIAMEMDLVARFAMRLNIMIETIVFTWLGGGVLIGLMIYLILIYRATRAARYANW